jgi:hypothetical protein
MVVFHEEMRQDLLEEFLRGRLESTHEHQVLLEDAVIMDLPSVLEVALNGVHDKVPLLEVVVDHVGVLGERKQTLLPSETLHLLPVVVEQFIHESSPYIVFRPDKELVQVVQR